MERVLGFIVSSKQDKNIIVHDDNEGAIHLAKKPLGSAQSKRIDVSYHSIRNEVEEGDVDITHIVSESQRPVVMTKPIPQEAFEKHSRYMLSMGR